MYNDCIVILPSLRDQILESIHAAHQCTGMMYPHAKSKVSSGLASASLSNSNVTISMLTGMLQPSGPLYPTPTSEYPFQLLCADFFQ